LLAAVKKTKQKKLFGFFFSFCFKIFSNKYQSRIKI